MILKTNPGSSATVRSYMAPEPLVEDENDPVQPSNICIEDLPSSTQSIQTFLRMFICFEGVKHGFLQGCMPFIGVDGFHLKGRSKGVMLAVVALDANLEFYPIAFAIVEAENNSSWAWFITELKVVIGDNNNGIPWCIMSDRQKGIIEVVPILPNALHRYCCWHLRNNFQKVFGDSELRNLFWAAAEAANAQKFISTLNHIQTLNKDAHKWLTDVVKQHWNLSSFDHRHKMEHLTNNFSESFNGWMCSLRFKPPIALFEGLRTKLFSMMWTRKEKAHKCEDKVTPKVRERINKLVKRSRYVNVFRTGEYEFQVDYDEERCVVRLDEIFCICGQWQVRGIPCVHACASIISIRADVADYCSKWFTTEYWRKCYSGSCHPISDDSMWPKFVGLDVKPPLVRNFAGRPRKVRIRSRVEPTNKRQSSTKKCKNCLMFGHFSSTCKAPRVTPQPSARGIGRPRGEGSSSISSTRGQERGRGRGRGRGMSSERSNNTTT